MYRMKCIQENIHFLKNRDNIIENTKCYINEIQNLVNLSNTNIARFQKQYFVENIIK